MTSKRQTTQDAFIGAATKLFAAYGYKGATVRNICKEAKRSIGTMYAHFRNKEALFRVMFRRNAHLFEGDMRDTCRRQGRRRQQLMGLASTCCRHKTFMRLVVADAQMGTGEFDRMAVAWAGRLRRWSPDVDPLHVIGAIQEAAGRLFFVKGDLVPRRVRQALQDAFVHHPPRGVLAA